MQQHFPARVGRVGWPPSLGRVVGWPLGLGLHRVPAVLVLATPEAMTVIGSFHQKIARTWTQIAGWTFVVAVQLFEF